MIRDKDEFKCLIYELLIGARNLEEYPVEESEVVQDEFKEGLYCSNAYEKVYNANHRLCERLNVDEDLLNIAKHLSMKMYDYGEYYANMGVNDIDKIICFYEVLSEERKAKFMNLISFFKKLIGSLDENE